MNPYNKGIDYLHNAAARLLDEFGAAEVSKAIENWYGTLAGQWAWDSDMVRECARARAVMADWRGNTGVQHEKKV